MAQITCDSHGDSQATYVCCHLTHSLNTKKPCGFHFLQDDEGDFQAFCDTCWQMPDHEWEAKGTGLIRLLCLECFTEIARLNEVTIGTT